MANLATARLRLFVRIDPTDIEIPNVLVQQVAGEIVSQKAKRMATTERKNYSQCIREVLFSDELLSNLYLNGPLNGIRYFLVDAGHAGQELIEHLNNVSH